MSEYILYGLSAFLLLVVVGYIIYAYVLLKWKCVEGKCEKSLSGTYKTSEECTKSCSKPKKQSIQPNPPNPVPQPPQKQTYDCVYDARTNTKGCKDSGDNGQYNTWTQCQELCDNEKTIYYPRWRPRRRRSIPWTPNRPPLPPGPILKPFSPN